MANTFEIDIATPEKLLLQQAAESAQIPGKDGYMGILPGHAALLSELAAGTLSVTSGGETKNFTVSGGYVEIRDNHVRVLADSAEQNSLLIDADKTAQSVNQINKHPSSVTHEADTHPRIFLGRESSTRYHLVS